MAYTKLFSSIVTSTIWMEPNETRIVWITLLALADKNGEVQGSVPGIARLAGVSVDECREAFKCLLGPDPDSRTKTLDGRRVVEIDGGWELINHAKYRALASKEELIASNAERQRRFRQRNALVTPSNALVTVNNEPVTQSRDIAEAEAEAEDKNTSIHQPPLLQPASGVHADALMVYDAYPRKQGKKAALKAIVKALKDVGVGRLLDRTEAFAEATKKWSPNDQQFIPHPATWFNRGSYDDDPTAWQRREHTNERRASFA